MLNLSQMRVRRQRSTLGAQQGMLLIEALVAMLIFSLGVIGLFGLQSASIKLSTAAEYRTIAALQASNLIGQMWVSDHSTTALQSNFASSPAGTAYTAWLSQVQASGLPGVSSTNQTLPTVALVAVAGGGASAVASTQATITLFWKAPGDTDVHSYVVIAQVK